MPAVEMFFRPRLATNYWLDVYVLAQERTAATFQKFQSGRLHLFSESRDKYEHPLNIDSEPVLDLSQLLLLLYMDTTLEYAIYWNSSRKAELLAGMVFFTADGGLILGLTVKDRIAESTLRSLSSEFSSQHGGMTVEQPPPSTAAEFRLHFPQPIS